MTSPNATSTRAAPLVGVVNQAFVRQVMNGESPIGKRILVDQGARVREIIGVVEDSRYASLKEDTPPLIYQPFLQTRTGRGQMTLHVRVAEHGTRSGRGRSRGSAAD